MFLWTQSLLSGTFHITTSNYQSSGLTFQNISSISTNDGFSYTGASAADIVVSGFYIPKGSKWTSLYFKVRSSGGSLDIKIRNNAGIVFYSKTGINATQTIDISSYSDAQNGKPVILEIKFYSNIKLDELNISYNTKSVFTYPAPYKLSTGKMTVAYSLPNDAYVTIRIFDNAGKLVRSIAENRFTRAKSSPLDNSDTWDGNAEGNYKVATGVYTVYVSVKEISSNNEAQSDYTSTFRFAVIR